MTTVRKSDGKVMDDLFIEIGQGPICPLCRWWGFDDWWHSNSCRDGSPPVRLRADLRCDDCDITFEVTQYTDGETHSSYRRPAPAVSEYDRGGAA